MTAEAENALMQSIREKWHTEIEQAVAGSMLPAEFVAALIANESGGNPLVKRFEKGVLAQLWDVLQRRSAHFGSIGRNDILHFIFAGPAPSDMSAPDYWLQRLDSLATSWGLTQIMGYEAIAFNIEIAVLQDPAQELQYTRRLVTMMATGAGLNLHKDFSEMFDLWNTGRPHAPTADPQYIPNGLARMALYRDLLPTPPPQAVSA